MGAARAALELRVERFVDDVEELVRRATFDVALRAGEGSGARAIRPKRSSGAKPAAGGETPRKPTHRSSVGREAGRAKSRGSTARREPKGRRQQGHVEEAMRDYVFANPGARMQEISAAVGRRTERLQPLMKRLLASRTLRKTGQRIPTRYYPVRGA